MKYLTYILPVFVLLAHTPTSHGAGQCNITRAQRALTSFMHADIDGGTAATRRLGNVLGKMPHPDPKLDGIVIQKLNAIIDNTSPVRRKALVQAIENARNAKLPYNHLGTSGEHASATRHIVIRLNEQIRNHPLGRAVLVHEVDHASRQVARNGKLRFSHYIRTEFLQNGKRAEETRAFRAEYAIYKNAYSKADLPALARQYPSNYPQYGEDFFTLKSMGLVTENGAFIRSKDNLQLLNIMPELQLPLSRFLNRYYNKTLVRRVQEAHELSETEFIARRLAAYKFEPADYNLPAVMGGAATIGGLSIWGVIEMLPEKDTENRPANKSKPQANNMSR
jgi:hypothetical protein